jgi:hypothetical protein
MPYLPQLKNGCAPEAHAMTLQSGVKNDGKILAESDGDALLQCIGRPSRP